MIGLKVNQAKSYFFDRPIVQALDRVAARSLGRFGAFVRRAARKLIRRPRQKSTGELSAKERQIWEIRKREAKQEGRPVPRRPLASSQPGEPPRSRVGLLRKFLFFAYDPDARSVVVGPVLINKPTGAPEVLEKGGTSSKGHRISARPYMQPAFHQELPALPRLISSAV